MFEADRLVVADETHGARHTPACRIRKFASTVGLPVVVDRDSEADEGVG